jgi:putative hydrolase of the HAD superfamily
MNGETRMALKDRRILSFDVVGTLIDFETGILRYVRRVAERHGMRLEDRAILEAYAEAEHSQHGLAPNLPFPEMMAPIFRQMASRLGLPEDEKSAESFRLSIPDWPAFPDSSEALQRLRTRFRLVAVTNSSNWALSHFARTLGSPFDDTVTAEDVGCNKPDPQVFAYMRGRQSVHGYGLRDFLHVAQSQYHDIGVAKRLGFEVCWIERRMGQEGSGATPGSGRVEPDHHFATLAELAVAVDAAFAGA